MIKRTKYPQKERLLGKFPMAVLSTSSNTVMAVVPDSNRIPFYIYSVNNFSNRIFLSIFDFYKFYYTTFGKICQEKAKRFTLYFSTYDDRHFARLFLLLSNAVIMRVSLGIFKYGILRFPTLTPPARKHRSEVRSLFENSYFLTERISPFFQSQPD